MTEAQQTQNVMLTKLSRPPYSFAIGGRGLQNQIQRQYVTVHDDRDRHPRAVAVTAIIAAVEIEVSKT